MSASPITLHVTRAAFGLPDTSPFVMKTEVQLKMAGLAYKRVAAIPPQAPSGKLPYIVDEGEVVTDSTFIRAYIERAYGVDLDAGLDARQRAECWAIERTLEDHLYFAMVWFRWIDPINFGKGPAQFASGTNTVARPNMLLMSQGFTYSYDLTKAEGQRISDMRLDGQPIADDRVYRVGVSNFLATGGDNFTVIAQGTDLGDGPLDIDAFEAWFAKGGAVAVPEANRITRLDAPKKP